jgi:Ca2+-transporting ATPase
VDTCPPRDRAGAVPDAPHLLAAADLCRALGTDALRGLAPEEAAARLGRHGRNELTAAPPVPAWRRLLAQFESPLVLLLVAAGLVSLAVWALENESAVPY